MAWLFISYKRGTSAVGGLMERLRAAHHQPWFDRDEIHLGDPHWQRRIDQGLERCKGLILCITPDACTSDPIRYEVQRALELKRPIFPIILERVASIPMALELLGLKTADMEPHVEDFTDASRWDENMKRLLADLIHQGLGVTRHDIRQLRDRDNLKYVQYQAYLTRLAERVGTLSLADITPDAAHGGRLEDVYVDSPTALNVDVTIKDWHVTNYSISLSITRDFIETRGVNEKAFQWITPDTFRLDPAPIDILIGGVESEIDAFRRENPNARPDGKTSDGSPSYRNNWADGDKPSLISLHLEHCAAGRERLVILGKPGSGKSTFVKHLALCLAGAQIDGWARTANLQAMPTWTHGKLTPVYVELRKFVSSSYFPQGKQAKPTVDDLWLYLQHEEFGAGLAEAWAEVRYDLEHGLAVLILDGLDEIPYDEEELTARQAQLIHLMTSLDVRLAQHGTSSRVIVTSRSYAYEGWKLPGFEPVTITDFDYSHRIALAERLFIVAGKSADDASAKAEIFNEQLYERRVHSELKDRPLFLTLMATLFLNDEAEGLPTRRGTLYRRSLLLLLDRWTNRRTTGRTLQEILGDHDPKAVYARLAALAFDVQDKYGDKRGTPEIDYDLIFKHLRPLGKHIAVDLIPYLSANAGVLVSPGQDEQQDVFHFAHRSFQEYLAASHLVEVCLQPQTDTFSQVRELMVSRPQVWREVGQFVGDVLADTGRKSELWQLLGDLIPDDAPETPNHTAWWAAWLGAVIVEQQELHLQKVLNRRTEQPVRDGLVEWFVKCVALGVLPPIERADCGRALGLLGDTRKGIGLGADGLPEFDWVDIPAGEFLYGDDKKQYTLKNPFKISRYPVTYSQFQAFIDALDGFHDSRWWDGLADDEYRRENQSAPGDQAFKFDNHPRDQVSWYDSIAFCRWLSFKLTGKVYTLDEFDQWPICLPTEFEWEKVARGTDGRVYPWGNEYVSGYANIDETWDIVNSYYLQQTTAVGMYPVGTSPYGVLDMSGNVWEWCLTDYYNPAPDAVDEDLRTDARRVLRGSSWVNDQVNARAASRFNGTLNSRDSNGGFRVVLRPSSLDY